MEAEEEEEVEEEEEEEEEGPRRTPLNRVSDQYFL